MQKTRGLHNVDTYGKQLKVNATGLRLDFCTRNVATLAEGWTDNHALRASLVGLSVEVGLVVDILNAFRRVSPVKLKKQYL